MAKLSAPRGTQDIFPPASAAWLELETRIHRLAGRFGYAEIRTPIFESTELFVRGVGEATDIVEKEMYTFTDKGDRSMTLRPEWTAPVVRAVLQHNLLANGPLRLYYLGPFFRYERPQAGRYRQANQFGVECLGYAGAEADVEVIQLAIELLASYGINDVRLNINSMGDEVCRPAYRAALLAHFRPHLAALCEDSQRRLERNPLRILDSKAPQDQPFIASAPSFEAMLCAPCRAHYATVLRYLDAMGIAYTKNPRLARGFDYYTRTVFELISDALGAQSTVCGGGRYDNLIASLGGAPTPAVGFGLGIERFLMIVAAAGLRADPARRGVQVAALGDVARTYAVGLVAALRRAYDAPTYIDYRSRKPKAVYDAADRHGARFAMLIGDDEIAAGAVTVRDLAAREDRALPLDPSGQETARAFVEFATAMERQSA